MYPNPVKDKLYLESNSNNLNYLVSLYDVLGKRIYKGKNSEIIDVSQLRRGVYFLKIEIEDTVLKKKVLVQ